MEDIGTPPYDSNSVEIWIHKALKKRSPSSQVADDLLKEWSNGNLLSDAKYSVSRFCIANGFVSSFLRAAKEDLKKARSLPWGNLTEVLLISQSGKDLIDTLLTGASKDDDLLATAAAGLTSKVEDPRWQKVFTQQIEERLAEIKTQRDKLFEDLKIFKHEGMETEIKDSLSKVLSLFPQDKEAQTLQRTLADVELDRNFTAIRNAHRKGKHKSEEASSWPEISEQIEKVKHTLDLKDCYYLSIALHQMGLHPEALKIIREKKEEWTAKERLWELELLVACEYYAEALEISQNLIIEFGADADSLRAALYFAARSYYGLEDLEQASSILRGIMTYDPNYRDCAILLIEWEAEHK